MTEGEMFERMIDGLKQASDAARLLAFHRSDPNWVLISSTLEGARDRCVRIYNARKRPFEHPFYG